MAETFDISTDTIVDERGEDSGVRSLRLAFQAVALEGDVTEEEYLVRREVPVFMGPQLPMVREWIIGVAEALLKDSYRAILAAHGSARDSEVSTTCENAGCVQDFLEKVRKGFAVSGFDPYPVSIWFVNGDTAGLDGSILLEQLRQSWWTSLRERRAIEVSAVDDTITVHCDVGLLPTVLTYSQSVCDVLGTRPGSR